MIPDNSKVTITDNVAKIKEFVEEIIVRPRQTLKKWAEITRQTPAFKVGYIGQHLASLITGVQGTGSGARGRDLVDGTEVKSCSKLDQLDTCAKCGAKVMRYETVCPNPDCNGTDIQRKGDSKWLFSITGEQQLHDYCDLNRILLILTDYPGFEDNNFETARIQAFEIYPNDPRCKVFNQLIDNHYHNIYSPKIDAQKKANPMNLHPGGIQFYKCNPTLVFECLIKNVNDPNDYSIEITKYFAPQEERRESVDMPSSLLKKKEWDCLSFEDLKSRYNLTMSERAFNRLTLKEKCKLVPYIDEELREAIPLREIVSSVQSQHS